MLVKQMTSSVKDILLTSGYFNKDGTNKSLAIIKEKNLDLKAKLLNVLVQNYDHLQSSFTSAQELLAHMLSNTKEGSELLIKIFHDSQINEEHDQEKDEAEKLLSSTTQTVPQLKKSHQNFEICNDDTSCVEIIGDAENVLNKLCTEMDVNLRSTSQMKLALRKEELSNYFQKSWKNNVSFVTDDSFIVLKLLNDVTYFKNLISVLLENGELDKTLSSFGKNLCTLVLQPLITQSMNVNLNESSTHKIISLTLPKRSCISPELSLQSLEYIFIYLLKTFASLKFDNDMTLFQKIGCEWGKPLARFIVENCLKPAILKSNKPIDRYEAIVKVSASFHNLLVKFNFLKEAEPSELINTSHLAEFLAKKLCQEYLDRAKIIIQKDFYPTCRYSQRHKSEKVGCVSIRNENDNPFEFYKDLIGNINTFPTCQISESIQELLALLNEILSKAATTILFLRLHFLLCTRYICDMFLVLAPKFHENSINNLPQQSAIFHNNCMYMGHALLTLAYKYEDKTSSSSSKMNFPYLDLIKKYRQMGSDKFIAQMRKQRNILIELITQDRIFESLAYDPSVHPKVEKYMKQSLCHLKLLKSVWASALPDLVYLKAMGTLVNSVVEEIIAHIITAIDISAESSSLISSILDLFLNQIPSLFELKDKNSVNDFVSSWLKMKELRIILEANLREIVARWTIGDGALTTVFKADEVEALIQALFRNTEQRAKALRIIKKYSIFIKPCI